MLPASVQGLLTARVDRLSSNDRELLQAASVIGRRFDAELLTVVASRTDVDNRLIAMSRLDLVHAEGKSSAYAFKHALVRDALYQSLLTDRRTVLHGKIAEEIARRSGNRLIEVAEVLAHHYSQTNQADKAFAYTTWLKPALVGEVKFTEWTADGEMRHPVFLGLRTDKKALDVVRE
jgi:predicted ATPase